jgi:hypothetical protein
MTACRFLASKRGCTAASAETSIRGTAAEVSWGCMIDMEIGFMGAYAPLIVCDSGRVKRSAWMASAREPDIKMFLFISVESALTLQKPRVL